MRAANLNDWGQPLGILPDSEEQELFDLGDELGDFGEPVDDRKGLLAVFSDFVVKLSMLVLLMVCAAAVAFCVYRLSFSFKPLIQKAVCEAPLIETPVQGK